MPVDVFGTPLYAGSAPRDQGAGKDHDCLCRTSHVDGFLLPSSSASVALDALGWVGW